METLSKHCKECGAVFFKKPTHSMRAWNERTFYCSIPCAHKHTLLDGSKQPTKEQRAHGERNNKWKGGKTCLICRVCSKTYEVDPYRAKNSKTCSSACNRKYRTSAEFRENQSVSLRTRPGYSRSLDWKVIVRTCSKYAQWRTKVFERDDYTCLECGQRGGKLNADHIKPFSTIAKEYNLQSVEDALWCDALWDVENGRTLCLSCHLNTATFGARALRASTTKSI